MHLLLSIHSFDHKCLLAAHCSSATRLRSVGIAAVTTIIPGKFEGFGIALGPLGGLLNQLCSPSSCLQRANPLVIALLAKTAASLVSDHMAELLIRFF